MLRTCLAAGRVDGTVSVFLEPIALYHTADLYESGDRAWLQPLPTDDHVPIGSARVHPGQHDGREDLLIVTYANGVPMSLRAARRLRDQGIDATVLDLRWLAPLPITDIVAHSRSGRILIVDETRTSGGVSEGIISRLVDAGYRGVIGRVAAKDSFIPLGDAALTVLVSEDEIVSAAQSIAAS
jgi:2-oxoisovalerate dehydrogenase E1 component